MLTANQNFKRLEGMITIEYRQHVQLEQDLLVGLLLAMHIGNESRKVRQEAA